MEKDGDLGSTHVSTRHAALLFLQTFSAAAPLILLALAVAPAGAAVTTVDYYRLGGGLRMAATNSTRFPLSHHGAAENVHAAASDGAVEARAVCLAL